jgi:hypothetical protein
MRAARRFRSCSNRRVVISTQPCEACRKDRFGKVAVMLLLKHLEKDSLLTKEETLQSKVGRPKMLYKAAPKLRDTVQTKLVDFRTSS